MSKLDELINEFCPNGVKFDQLNTVLDYEQPTKYIVNKTDYDDSFKTPVLTAGQSFILGYTNEVDDIYNATKETPTIIFDDFTTSFHWVDFNFKIKSSAMKMLRIKPDKLEDTLLRYVYHCMKSIQYEPVDHSRQWIAKYSNFRIPLPHIEVQREIVRILDNFTELTARKKQYEYYRDNLLTFDNEEFEWNTLGAITNLSRGVRVVRSQLNSQDKYPVYQNSMIPLGYFNKSNYPAKTTFIISAGAAGSVGYSDIDFWAADDCYCLVCPKGLDSRYLYHALSNQQNYIFSQVRKASIPRIGRDVVEKIKIPIPYPEDSVKSLAEQQRIVDILDRFDTFCNNITKGLPAEIGARQKQYEYYRDKLLTFKEKLS